MSFLSNNNKSSSFCGDDDSGDGATTAADVVSASGVMFMILICLKVCAYKYECDWVSVIIILCMGKYLLGIILYFCCEYIVRILGWCEIASAISEVKRALMTDRMDNK